MRLFIAATLAASLFATNLLAAETVGPLAAGKPAGVKTAQASDNTVWFVVGGLVAVGVIAAVASDSGGFPNPGAGSIAASVTTTS